MINERSIFLLDGVGAVSSALLTGFVLPLFSESLGLPTRVLYGLASFPVLYGIYSICCYRFAKTIQPWMLLAIGLANTFYCVLSAILIFTLESMTFQGRALLTAEIAVILWIVALEIKVYRGMMR